MKTWVGLVRSVVGVSLALGLANGWAQSFRPWLDPTCGLPGVRILPKAGGGGDFRIYGSSNLGGEPTWEPLAEMTVGEKGAEWRDFNVHSHHRRFFRLEQIPVRPPLAAVDNFRLIDQNGRAHELHRAGEAAAYVLVFADNLSLARAWPEVKQLRDTFSSKGIRFWIINPHDDRTAIMAKAAELRIDLPVLHDRAQLVARAFRCSARLEAVAIRGDDFTPFYRGAIRDVSETIPVVEQNYLADALNELLGDQLVSLSFVRANAGPMSLRETGGLDYARDIAPIFQKRCVQCHRKGDIGSFEMSNHGVLQSRLADIRRDILTGDMPPWHMDPNSGKFANDFSLLPEEASKLVAWLDAGAPKGDGGDPLVEKPVAPAVDWPLGEPDYKFSLEEYTIPASGTVDYQYLAFRNPIPTNAWLRATVIRPSNRTVVHHALAFAGGFNELQALSGGLGGYFAAYVPGMDQTFYPAGTGKLLKAGAWFLFQMHYTTSGVEAKDRSEVGLYFSKEPPQRELKTMAAYNTKFQIPAYAQDHEVVAVTKPFAKAVFIYEMSPHMHYRGARMRFEALLPDGSVQVLANIPAYQFDWQTLYRLDEPVLVPAGTRVRVVGGFDNSQTNPRLLPDGLWGYNQPVIFGEQSWEEMLVGYLNFTEAQ